MLDCLIVEMKIPHTLPSPGPSRVKSPTPLTLRIPKDQLLSTKRSPPPSSTLTEAGKQHKAKVQPKHGMVSSVFLAMFLRRKKRGNGRWKRERGEREERVSHDI